MPSARPSTSRCRRRPRTEGFLHVIRNVVMPILDEFKPDLVINSAGQDNHYSDPITNMKFSAQGYAELTELLNPDIAVLEGGYSIEGALPYVNVGIILAMAGLDYSHVREPDYNAAAGPAIDRGAIGETRRGSRPRSLDEARELRPGWRQRTPTTHASDLLRHGRNPGAAGGTVRICEDCGGAIESMSTRTGKRMYAVLIPRKPVCSHEGGHVRYDKAWDALTMCSCRTARGTTIASRKNRIGPSHGQPSQPEALPHRLRHRSDGHRHRRPRGALSRSQPGRLPDLRLPSGRARLA